MPRPYRAGVSVHFRHGGGVGSFPRRPPAAALPEMAAGKGPHRAAGLPPELQPGILRPYRPEIPDRCRHGPGVGAYPVHASGEAPAGLAAGTGPYCPPDSASGSGGGSRVRGDMSQRGRPCPGVRGKALGDAGPDPEWDDRGGLGIPRGSPGGFRPRPYGAGVPFPCCHGGGMGAAI